MWHDPPTTITTITTWCDSLAAITTITTWFDSLTTITAITTWFDSVSNSHDNDHNVIRFSNSHDNDHNVIRFPKCMAVRESKMCLNAGRLAHRFAETIDVEVVLHSCRWCEPLCFTGAGCRLRCWGRTGASSSASASASATWHLLWSTGWGLWKDNQGNVLRGEHEWTSEGLPNINERILEFWDTHWTHT